MSHRRERVASTARVEFALLLAFNALFLLIFAGALGGFVYLIAVGWWADPAELLAGAILILTAIGGIVFFADGIRRDFLATGIDPWRELRQAGRRWRRSAPTGTFASQRYTGRRRRR